MKGVRLTDRGWLVLTVLLCALSAASAWAVPIVAPWAGVRL